MSQELAIVKRVKWWAGVYEYHQQQAPSAAVLEQYAKDLMPYSAEEVVKAWEKWRTQSGFAPKPGDLIPLMARRMDLEDRAQLMAQNLFYCVSFYAKHSTCYPQAAESWIRENIGDIGWLAVDQLGGWKPLWNRSDKLEPEKTIGAWRKMFMALLVSEEVDGPICLPTKREATDFLASVGANVKQVDFKKRQAGDME